MLPLVLASTSPYRRAMFEACGLPVEAVGSGVDEDALVEPDPRERALELARRKADAVALRMPGRWVLGADQVAYDDRESFGKPRDPEDHLRRLMSLRGKEHHLVVGWVLVGPEGQRIERTTTTALRVRDDLTDAELSAYVACGEGSDCAGGYAIEGRGLWLFAEVDGDWLNILGLPMMEVLGVLREHGWRMQP